MDSHQEDIQVASTNDASHGRISLIRQSHVAHLTRLSWQSLRQPDELNPEPVLQSGLDVLYHADPVRSTPCARVQRPSRLRSLRTFVVSTTTPHHPAETRPNFGRRGGLKHTAPSGASIRLTPPSPGAPQENARAAWETSHEESGGPVYGPHFFTNRDTTGGGFSEVKSEFAEKTATPGKHTLHTITPQHPVAGAGVRKRLHAVVAACAGATEDLSGQADEVVDDTIPPPKTL